MLTQPGYDKFEKKVIPVTWYKYTAARMTRVRAAAKNAFDARTLHGELT